jgi:thymidylate kinase
MLSSLTYQTLHCDPEWVQAINAEAIRPNLTFLLDLPVDLALERLARRSLFTAAEIYETAEQLGKICGLYHKAVNELSSEQEIIAIDGSVPPEEVHRLIVAQLRPRLEAYNI